MLYFLRNFINIILIAQNSKGQLRWGASGGAEGERFYVHVMKLSSQSWGDSLVRVMRSWRFCPLPRVLPLQLMRAVLPRKAASGGTFRAPSALSPPPACARIYLLAWGFKVLVAGQVHKVHCLNLSFQNDHKSPPSILYAPKCFLLKK